MPLMNFVSRRLPAISAAWLNAVDVIKVSIFGDATTKAQARTNLTSDAAFEVANGGTGSRNGQIIPAADNTATLGNASTSFANLYLGANHYPVLDASGNVGYFARTAAEISAGVTPTNFFYPFGDLRRYGAVGGPSGSIPSTDDSTAWARAVSCGYVIVPQNMAFKIVTGTSVAAPVIVVGFGPTSQLYNDSAQGVTPLLTVTNGNNSYFGNVYVGSITAPLTIQRYIATSVATTWSTPSGNTIIVANATGIVIGMQAVGVGIWENSIVTGVSGTTITLSKAAPGTSGNIRFSNVTFNAVVGSGTITGITKAASAVITVNTSSGTNPYSTGMTVGIGGVLGMTQINGLTGTISAIGGSSGAWTLTVNINSSGFSTYTSGGVVSPALATLAQSTAVGRYSPNVNDTDVWNGLTTAQQNATQIGPQITITGDYVTVEKVTGQGLSISLVGSDCIALNNILRGGWNFASITMGGLSNFARAKNNKAIGNDIQDHGFNGILFISCEGCTAIGNTVYGVGETGIKTYQDGYGCTGVLSSGNRCVACFQGAFDYQQLFPNNGNNTAMSSSIGDYAAWCPNGAFAYGGSGWNIHVCAELNPGPALYAVVSDSNVSGCFRENCYANLNTGIPNACLVSGSNNIVTGLRVSSETTREGTSGYLLAFTGGTTAATSSSLVNCDLRDGVTPSTNCLILSNITSMSNVRTNGTLDSPIWSVGRINPTYGANITIDVSKGNHFAISANNGSAFTINNPTNIAGAAGQRITISITNVSGGALGAVTWGGNYKLATWTSPANGNNRSIEFEFDGSSSWLELNRTTADVPN